MDYCCPHCLESLRGKRIALASVPRQGMHKRALACPYCSGTIAVNKHMAEYSYQFLWALPAAPLSIFFIEDKGEMAVLAIGVVLLICSISISATSIFLYLKIGPVMFHSNLVASGNLNDRRQLETSSIPSAFSLATPIEHSQTAWPLLSMSPMQTSRM